ncbi:thioesterase II family protein [Streptomyces sp. VRA16 Mangrove soil]|uniref:thioesterase II family protein n=1 Tax=Streptomyces sp. VRA16 Mangrove soil TaxID=2817434 RepID=UPI001A9EEFC2|nr:thioesterase domain-containing protein [Streptomyces sp. VRA16 Mangrove soil]MBO1335677.1 thioesterase [Streptomyces sp. VRA16 Mangrove soil]
MPVRTYALKGADPREAAWRVLLVPHAGAGAAAGAAFASHAPADWAVATARLPGRESRVREPVGGLPGLTADVVATARALPGTAPLLVVGVCSGAVLALEAVRALQRDGDVPVAGFVAVSQWAVTERPDPGRRLLRDTDDRAHVLDILREFGGVPEALAANEEMLALLLPSIVADMRAVEEYSSSPDPRLECPLLTVFGDEDPLCPQERTEDWELFATRTRTVWLPGGHMLLTDEPALLADAVAGSLDHFTEGVPA